MLTEEKINANYVTFCKLLQKYDCYSDSMDQEIGELIKNGSFALQEKSGSAYNGSLLDVVINKLTKTALDINGVFETSHKLLACNPTQIVRVCLLQHLGKAVMFKPSTDQWRINKLGEVFTFSDDTYASLKLGERSLFLCQKYGIQISEPEYEAIRILDKKEEEITMNSNPLATLIRMANNLVAIEQRLYTEQVKTVASTQEL